MRPRSSILPIFYLLFASLSVATLRSIDPTYGVNQLLFFIAGFLVYILVSSFSFDWLQRTRWVWYLGVVGLLVLTLVIGTATKGSVAWLRFGSYRLQPSEFLKPALALLLAVQATRFPLKNLRHLSRFSLFLAAGLGLVLIQPDLGTSLVILSGVGALFLATQPPRQYLIALSAVAMATVLISWLFLLEPYQKDRIMTFLAPQMDPLGSGYNARQAIIAVGSGEIMGQGLGSGLQSTLRFLPERQTDFLFASYAEQTGFIGSVFLILLYLGLLAYSGLLLQKLDQPVPFLTILTLNTMLLAQIVINIGMNIGIMPITGVTLPLFSLGGSSILATAITLGIFESARRSAFPSPPHVS